MKISIQTPLDGMTMYLRYLIYNFMGTDLIHA